MQSKFTQSILLAALIGGGALGASAWAMNADKAAGKPGCEMRHGQAMKAKWEARRDERLGELKERLKLAPSQEAAWQAFVASAARTQAAPDADRAAMREAFAGMSTPQRLDSMLERADQRRAQMAARAEAVKAFYAQLTPEQQKVFDAEAMPKRGHGGGHGHRGHMRHQS
ncbi:MAG: Spy/CpxP family protein refolding chaperone [Pseudomonadota bacterium]